MRSRTHVGVEGRWARPAVLTVVTVWALLVGAAVSDPQVAAAITLRAGSHEAVDVTELPALPVGGQPQAAPAPVEGEFTAPSVIGGASAEVPVLKDLPKSARADLGGG